MTKSNHDVFVIVDDEKDIAHIDALILYRFFGKGINIRQFHNGKDFIEYEQTTTENIQLIILDILMPIMSGLEVLEILNHKYDDRVIISSGYIPTIEKSKPYLDALDNRRILHKPFDNIQLRVAVSTIETKLYDRRN